MDCRNAVVNRQFLSRMFPILDMEGVASSNPAASTTSIPIKSSTYESLSTTRRAALVSILSINESLEATDVVVNCRKVIGTLVERVFDNSSAQFTPTLTNFQHKSKSGSRRDQNTHSCRFKGCFPYGLVTGRRDLTHLGRSHKADPAKSLTVKIRKRREGPNLTHGVRDPLIGVPVQESLASTGSTVTSWHQINGALWFPFVNQQFRGSRGSTKWLESTSRAAFTKRSGFRIS